jgi:hypothetical protein
MKRALGSLALGGLVVAASALAATSASPPPVGLWTGDWKVIRIESDSGRRLPGGRLTFLQRGRVVCGTWSWNRFTDGRAGVSRGTASGLTMRARGRDGHGAVNWTIALRAEVVDGFIGRFTEVDTESEEPTQGTMYGTRIGPPLRRPVC